MKSILKIYKTVLTPARNALVDDIEYYLTNEAELYHQEESFQYQRLNPRISIAVRLHQSELSAQDVGNYVSITQDGKTWYYFVLSYEWRATETLLLNLAIDSVNTFRDNFTFSDKTVVNREHKDRIVQPLSIEFTWSSPVTLGNYEGLTCNVYQDNKLKYENVVCIKQFTKTGTDMVERHYLQLIHQNKWLNLEAGNYTMRFKSANTTLVLQMTVVSVVREQEYYRNIDFVSEGVVAESYKQEENTITDSLDLDWYLIYMNQNDIEKTLNTPINLYLCASEGIYAKTEEWRLTLTPDMFSVGRYYYIYDDVQVNIGTGVLYFETDAPNRCFQISSNGSSFEIVLLEFNRKETYSGITSISVLFNTKNITIKDSDESVSARVGNDLTYIPPVRNATATVYEATSFLSAPILIEGIGKLDRTDSRITSIIKLPYCPIQLRYDNVFAILDTQNLEVATIEIKDEDEEVIHTTRVVKLKNINVAFDRTINAANPLNNLRVYGVDLITNKPKDSSYESKLWHSDFTTYKFVYDSFSFDLQLEKESFVKADKFPLTYLPVEYIVSKNGGSTMMFKFNDYVPGNYSSQDYDSFLIVNRNNQETIYNNSYIDYLRNGYNLDKKVKQQQDFATWFGVGVSGVQTIANFATGGITGAALSTIAGIGSTSNLAISLASAINDQTIRNESFKTKQQQLKAQSSSVFGSDDIEVMSYYSGNRAKIVKYSVNEEIRERLFDLFHYCGYVVPGTMKVPNLNTRYWFNYIKCEPIFTEEETTPYNDFLEDIKARFAVGLTVYHRHTQENNSSYDWEQQYENWENSLMEA